MSYNLSNLSLREIRALRKSTDFIPITGIDAIFIGNLQIKLDTKITTVENISVSIPPPPTSDVN